MAGQQSNVTYKNRPWAANGLPDPGSEGGEKLACPAEDAEGWARPGTEWKPGHRCERHCADCQGRRGRSGSGG